ncbi:hypothetical protein HMI54_003809, partial [Coelomomyces lativittatus]
MHSKIFESLLLLTLLFFSLHYESSGEPAEILQGPNLESNGMWVDIFFSEFDEPSVKEAVLSKPPDSVSESHRLNKNRPQTTKPSRVPAANVPNQARVQMNLEPYQVFEEMKSFSTVFFSSEFKNNLEGLSPAGVYLTLNRFINFPQKNLPSHNQVIETWKLNPFTVSPKSLVTFDKYLATNHIDSVNLFYQPPGSENLSREFLNALSSSETEVVYSEDELSNRVSEKTQGQVKKVQLPHGSTQPQVLFNIIVLKFNWFHSFYRTIYREEFFTDEGGILGLSFAAKRGDFAFTINPDYTAFKLDFTKDPNANVKERLEDFSAYFV